MLLKLENPKRLLDVVGIISELVLEVRIKVNKDGMSIIAIDPANVAMIASKLPASNFSELKIEKDEILGVNLENLKAVLRRVKGNSILVIRREENELKIEIQDKIKREFSLALIDIESEEKEIPMLDFTSKIEMNSIDFSEAIEDCAVVADSCAFISAPDKFTIKAKGSLNSFKSEFSSDEANIVATIAESKYSLEYLQKIIKAAKVSDKLTINFSTDYPLKLEFNSNLLELSFILAPRVEQED
jgi:proliferating cell nuclear antigen